MLTYQRAKELFESARNKEKGKPISYSCRVVQRGDAYAVKMHNTDILTFLPDGSCIYFTGGWRTVTTKQRMNDFGPARVWSERGMWYIRANGRTEAFAERCRVWADGVIEGAANTKVVKAECKLREKTKVFAKRYVERLIAGKIKEPGGGDCWMCLLTDQNSGKAWGEMSDRPHDHILCHIQENYYVPSLIWRAMEAMGSSVVMRHCVAKYQGTVSGETYHTDDVWMQTQLTKCLRRYCLRELGLAY